ncbi:MAG: fimbrillin family protein, partial [Bacteroidaceae bacterium]|nr:fimbrillin family protein [Bacteroidaceae bacterium]
MKKSLFLAALAAIALASCTQNEDFSQPEKINFNPVNYKAQSTKAPINTTTYSTTDPSFGVFAF